MMVVVVKIEYPSARHVTKFERAITKHVENLAQAYLNVPDKKGSRVSCVIF